MRTLALLLKTLLLIAAGAVVFNLPLISFAADDASPAQVVTTFNAAVTARDMDTALAQLAEGSVQFQLRAAHPGMSDNPPLTSGLKQTWQTVAAILFPSTDAYARTVEVTDTRIDGEIATVWTNTRTTTQRKKVAESMVLEFTELYLLVGKSDGWKIAGIVDNRQPDSIRVNTAE
jgi:hypothetical protein